MSLLARSNDAAGAPRGRAMARRLVLAAGFLAGAPLADALADTLPETTVDCGSGHFFENETNRLTVLTVQVFNGCSGLAETVEINLFAPGVSETVTEVRQRETRAVTFRVPKGGAVQVRGPGGSGELKSSFSVVAR